MGTLPFQRGDRVEYAEDVSYHWRHGARATVKRVEHAAFSSPRSEGYLIWLTWDGGHNEVAERAESLRLISLLDQIAEAAQ